MSSEKAPSLRSIRKTSLADQREDKIIDICLHSCTIANSEARSLFTEGYISLVMRTRLNSPVSAANFQEFHWRNFFV